MILLACNATALHNDKEVIMSMLTELLKKKNWRIWMKGLLSAAISGGATGIAAALSAPQGYGFKSLLIVMFTAGTAGAALYITKSPMPEWEEEASSPT